MYVNGLLQSLLVQCCFYLAVENRKSQARIAFQILSPGLHLVEMRKLFLRVYICVVLLTMTRATMRHMASY